jgi:exopolyphosphatase/pppGpp-phosphohydrolase
MNIGSDSVKLIVVEASTSDSFVLTREKEFVRLGHHRA